MRKLQWQKIPLNNIVNKDNVWTMVGKKFHGYQMDYHKMDELFALHVEPAGAKRPGQAADGTPDTKKKKESTEVGTGTVVVVVVVINVVVVVVFYFHLSPFI